jgi:hypothetical protein
MKIHSRRLAPVLAIFVAANSASAQNQATSPQKSSATTKQTSSSQNIGQSYAQLRPEQRQLVDEFVRRYNATAGGKFVPEEAYDNARMSVRTTFDAVTHALLNAKLTDAHGKGLGRALDLVEAVDEVMGEESGVGGDRQFRLYVYLKPNTMEILAKSQEFFRDKDNATYHKGFPISYRLKNGPPSIQLSISRDKKMADADVDYRSSTFPKGLFNGHLTAANSDVRAGDNLQRHDNRWSGLNGWWRDVFVQFGTGSKPPKETATESLGHIPLNPAVKADEGVDKSAHDFLKAWVVDKKPNKSVAYFSRRSYPCLESIAQKGRKPMQRGMVRIRTEMAMKTFSDSSGTVASVNDVFEAADKWEPELRDAKNAFTLEFRLVKLPSDMGQDQECASVVADDSEKSSRETLYATAFRGKRDDSRNKLMSLVWAREGDYWKIVAIRIEDGSDSGIVPKSTTAKLPEVEELKPITGDPAAVKDITAFYQLWIGERDSAQAARFASQRSYTCISAPTDEQKKLTPSARIQSGLEKALKRIPSEPSLADMMSSLQPVDDLLRPVEQNNSKAFAIMAVPDQMAPSFLCQNRHLSGKNQELKPADAMYGSYYLSASRLNFGDEESPGLLLLWNKEKTDWKVVAWAVEVP